MLFGKNATELTPIENMVICVNRVLAMIHKKLTI